MRDAAATDTTRDTCSTDADLLQEAQAAFERGDHMTVRRLCARLQGAADADVREGAAALRRRIAVDPAQGVVLAGCLALFALLVYLYLLS